MFAVLIPSIPARFAGIFRPFHKGSNSAEIVRPEVVSDDEDEDESNSNLYGEFETAPAAKLDPRIEREIEAARPVLVTPDQMTITRTSAEDVAKLMEFILFVNTLIDLCSRIVDVTEICKSIKSTTRKPEEIVKGQSQNFWRMADQLQRMKRSPTGQYIVRMSTTVRSVTITSITEKVRIQTEFFCHFTKSRYVGVKYSNTFEKLVMGVMKLFEHLSHFEQCDLFAYDPTAYSVSYMQHFLTDLNEHLNYEVLQRIFEGMNLSMREEDAIRIIREEMGI